MDQVLGLKCTICGAEYAVDQVEYVCPDHGDDGILDVVYDYDVIRHRFAPDQLANASLSMWRYLPLLPIDPQVAGQVLENTVLSTVGWTPLYPAPRLAAGLGLKWLWVKDDSRQPTASFKDRASAIAVVKTRELGYGVVTTAWRDHLILHSGEYHFKRLYIGGRTKITVQLSDGQPLIVRVQGNLTFGSRVNMEIEGGDASDVLFLSGGSNVRLGMFGTHHGTFVAPDGRVTLGYWSKLTGAAWGRDVLARTRARVTLDPFADW